MANLQNFQKLDIGINKKNSYLDLEFLIFFLSNCLYFEGGGGSTPIWKKFTFDFFAPFPKHCCIVVHINVPQQQNIFFSRMNRPSDNSSRRIIPVQFWDLLHTWKDIFQKLEI